MNVMSRRTFLKWCGVVAAVVGAWLSGVLSWRRMVHSRKPRLHKARYYRRVVSWCLFFSAVCVATGFAQVREPVVSGRFYPDQADELHAMVKGYIDAAEVPVRDPQIVVAPHAGYVYSGPIAGYAYKTVMGNTYDTVVVLAFSHHVRYPGVSIFDGDAYRTPLGDIPIDKTIVDELRRDSFFDYYPKAHMREHSLEVQLPFLQVAVPDLKIVPLLMGDMSQQAAERLAAILERVLAEKRALIVVSTDLSHYEPYDEAMRRDSKTVDLILSTSFQKCVEGIRGGKLDACGKGPILTAVLLAEHRRLSSTLLRYANSGDTAGDKRGVVGYASIAFHEKPKEDTMSAEKQTNTQLISDAGRKQLLSLARETLQAHLSGKPKPVLNDPTDELVSTNGAFVTLHKSGALRGCIGCFVSEDPLYETVQSFVINSALNDPRFPAVTVDEVDALDIEISVLSPMRRIESIDEFELGKHGIWIKKGYRSGTFLPQVAHDTGWNVEEFLGHCARDKAGIGWDGWQDAELYVYTAEVFGEKDF